MKVRFYAAEWVHYLPQETLVRIASGETVMVGSKMLKLCRGCMSVIQLNKPIVGSLHLCA